MKTQFYTASSLDGFIATEDDSLEWLFPLGNPKETSYPDFVREVGALVMGANTYEWILNHCDAMLKETGSPWPYSQPAWIFTHRDLPIPSPEAQITFVRGAVETHFSQIQEQAGGKNLWIVGGGDLAGQFYDASLLDEVIVQIAPVTLGAGKPLFPRRQTSAPWKLRSMRQYGLFAELRYQVKPKGEAL